MAVRLEKDPITRRVVPVHYPDPCDRAKHEPPRPAGRIQMVNGRLVVAPLPDEAPVAREFVAGVDLAQATDFSAVAVVERLQDGRYGLVHLERFTGRPYPDIVARVAELVEADPLARQTQVVIDGTGVGRPAMDIATRYAWHLTPAAVTITSGDKVRGSYYWPRVPKRDLVTVLQLALQHHALLVPADLSLRAEFSAELTAFRRVITQAGNDTYSAPPGQHDDLLIATCLALWWLERRPTRLQGNPASLPAP